MTKVTLIGIDTAKQVFHLVGVDAKGHYVWRRKLSRARLLSTLRGDNGAGGSFIAYSESDTARCCETSTNKL